MKPDIDMPFSRLTNCNFFQLLFWIRSKINGGRDKWEINLNLFNSIIIIKTESNHHYESKLIHKIAKLIHIKI